MVTYCSSALLGQCIVALGAFTHQYSIHAPHTHKWEVNLCNTLHTL